MTRAADFCPMMLQAARSSKPSRRRAIPAKSYLLTRYRRWDRAVAVFEIDDVAIAQIR